MPGVFVTGASGFVGQALCADLRRRGLYVVAGVRSAASAPPGAHAVIGDLAELPDLRGVLTGMDCVVHLAARAHVLREREPDPEAAYRRSNVAATRHVAEQAARAGVRRMVLLSSVKVQGEATRGRALREQDPPAPVDAYGRSKLAAEEALRQVGAATGLETVVIRPPLIHGPGVKANFRSLLAAIERGLPLPFGSVDNRRSLVSLDNLCDLIACCIDHPAAGGETFLVSDGLDFSTPELIRSLAYALDRPARLLRVPPMLLRLAGRALGSGDRIERLIGSLQVDASKAARRLGWHPPLAAEEGLARTARAYLDVCRG